MTFEAPEVVKFASRVFVAVLEISESRETNLGKCSALGVKRVTALKSKLTARRVLLWGDFVVPTCLPSLPTKYVHALAGVASKFGEGAHKWTKVGWTIRVKTRGQAHKPE